MNKYAVMNTLFSTIGGVVIGGAVTLLLTKKHFEDYADEEIEKVRHHYALIRKDQNVVSIFADMNTPEEEPQSTLPKEGAGRLIEELGYNGPVDDGRQTDDDTSGEGEPVAEKEESISIFKKAVPEEQVGDEIEGPSGQPKKNKSNKRRVIVTGREESNNEGQDSRMDGYVRHEGEPYIISQDEMFNTETEWEKPTLSYYEGDDTLVDERNKIMDDRERYVGSRHLSMFGVLSEDENIVYVRSPQISADFEIILEPGKYSVRVLGEPDYEEVEKQRVRRMRASD